MTQVNNHSAKEFNRIARSSQLLVLKQAPPSIGCFPSCNRPIEQLLLGRIVP